MIDPAYFLGSSPHLFPIADLQENSMFLHVFTRSVICSLQFNLSSIVSPRYLVCVTSFIFLLLIFIDSGFSFSCVVQHKTWVFTSLSVRPFSLHHVVMVFYLCNCEADVFT